MDSINAVRDYFHQSIAVKQAILAEPQLVSQIAESAQRCVETLQAGHKILFAGNGGSAADSQHLAAEFVSRFNFNRPGLAAQALTTDSSILTAIGNDYGFENLFSRQIEANGQKGDLFFAISTSGDSPNIIKAVECAKAKGITVIGMCGNKGKLASLADIALQVPSAQTSLIQEAHITIGHIVCGLVESQMFQRT